MILGFFDHEATCTENGITKNAAIRCYLMFNKIDEHNFTGFNFGHYTIPNKVGRCATPDQKNEFGYISNYLLPCEIMSNK